MPKNPKNWWKLMKIANIVIEILHNFWTTWINSIKFSGKMCLMIIIKVRKKQGFTLSLEDTFLKNRREGSIWLLSPPPAPPSRFRVKIIWLSFINSLWFSLGLTTSNLVCSSWFILFYFQVGLLLNNVYNFKN